jgi:ureidoacrylate peracid hydrolase
VPIAREVVPNVNRISAAMRAHGGRNVFLRMTVDADSRASWSNWFAHLHSLESGTSLTQAFARNAHYWQLWPALAVTGDDLVVDKYRFGAFVPGASDLHEVLQRERIDTLIISGTLSNCCCESTARDAMQMNYKIIFVSDANAALSDAAHNATLENMAFLFGDVMSTAELLHCIAQSATPAPRRAESG